MVPADGSAVVHGVECGDLVNSHGRHLEYLGHLVHDADARVAVLPLAEVEEGHDGCFFVLAGVSGEDFLDEAFVLGVEFEGDRWVVFWRVPMLLYY